MRCPGSTQLRPSLTIMATRRIALFQEIVPDGPLISSLGVSERKELLRLVAQRIAELPLPSKKVLAMYYYENLPITGIAACFNLPARQIEEIFTETVALLENDLLKQYRCRWGGKRVGSTANTFI